MFGSYEHLISIYSEERVLNVAQFSELDSTLGEFVNQKDPLVLKERVELFLERASIQLRSKLFCCGYDMAKLDELILEGKEFPVLKDYEAKLAYILLKEGTDCEACKTCLDGFMDYCKCMRICSSDGDCLDRTPPICVEEKPACIPSMCETCCMTDCCCEGV